eukprot:6575957-Prorocentrum_lima.AAC.1
MTSSLVGSEMCIRDSARGAAQAGGGFNPLSDEFDQEVKARLAMVAPAPVSYTHLTLPTICSV